MLSRRRPRPASAPASAPADTPERDTPYSTRQAPDDQYTNAGNNSNNSNNANPGNANGNPGNTGKPGKQGRGKVLGKRGGRSDRGRAGERDSSPVRVSATARGNAQTLDDDRLPFTGGALGLVVGIALVLLFAGALLRVVQRRLSPSV